MTDDDATAPAPARFRPRGMRARDWRPILVVGATLASAAVGLSLFLLARAAVALVSWWAG